MPQGSSTGSVHRASRQTSVSFMKSCPGIVPLHLEIRSARKPFWELRPPSAKKKGNPIKGCSSIPQNDRIVVFQTDALQKPPLASKGFDMRRVNAPVRDPYFLRITRSNLKRCFWGLSRTMPFPLSHRASTGLCGIGSVWGRGCALRDPPPFL